MPHDFPEGSLYSDGSCLNHCYAVNAAQSFQPRVLQFGSWGFSLKIHPCFFTLPQEPVFNGYKHFDSLRVQQNAEAPFPAGTQELFLWLQVLLGVGCASGWAWPGHADPGTSGIQGKFKPIFMCFSSNSACLLGVLPPPATPHKQPCAQQGAPGTCWFPSAHAETPESHSSPLPGQNSCAAPKVLVIHQDKREQNSERGTPAKAGSSSISCLFILQGLRSGFHFWD